MWTWMPFQYSLFETLFYSRLTRWISRLWRKIVDQLEGQWEARKRSLFWRDPQLTSLLLTNVTTDVDKTGEDNSSRNLVAQCHKLERAWKHNDIFARKAFESIPLSVSLDSLHDRLAVGLNDGSVELFEISTNSKLWVKTSCHSKGTLFENYPKCRILAFSTNFCPTTIDLSGNTVWPQDSGFQKLAKMDHFWHF